MALCATACAANDEGWDQVRQTGVLRIGMDASFPPFEWIGPEGELTGFDVALARELGHRLDLEVQFVANLPYDGLYDALAVGQVDAVISALAINPDRMADFAYSTPYFDAGQVLVVSEDESGIQRIADLRGRLLAVEFGSQGDQLARTWTRRLGMLAIIPFQTAQEALVAVRTGVADVALVDHVSALAGLASAADTRAGGRLAIVGNPVIEEPYAVAVRREDGRLLRAINKALAAIQTDGTLDVLGSRWLRNGDDTLD